MIKTLSLDFDKPKKKQANRKTTEKKICLRSIFSKHKKCPECKSRVKEKANGEMYCHKCGFVIL